MTRPLGDNAPPVPHHDCARLRRENRELWWVLALAIRRLESSGEPTDDLLAALHHLAQRQDDAKPTAQPASEARFPW